LDLRISLRRDLAAPGLLLCLSAAFFFWRAKHGMRFSTFGDETMHFVGAQVLLSGGVLYRDFIELHGPIAYAIPQLYGAVFGWHKPLHTRIILIGLTLGTAVCAACSGCLQAGKERLLAPAIFLGLTTTLWLVQGLCLYDYQPVAGALLAGGFALAVTPPWYGRPAGSTGLFMGGLAFSLAPFVAFSYGPSSVLFFTSTAWSLMAVGQSRRIVWLLGGSACGVAATLCWMLRYADFRGYVVFHIIHALVDFGPYLQFGFMPALRVLWLPIEPSNIAQIMGVVAAALGVAASAVSGALRRQRMVPFLLGIAGVIASNSRGSSGFQDGAFLFIAFVMFAVSAAQLPRHMAGLSHGWRGDAWVVAMALVVILAEMSARQAVSSPHGYFRRDMANLAHASLAQSDVSWAAKIRAVTNPGEGILAVPFWPDMYMLAGRPPMHRYVYYLPWDADYARRPWLGLSRDFCADVARDKPPVIYDNNWVVWHRYDPRRYMACLAPILSQDYTPMPGEKDFYVRNDRMARLPK
jgi:hypothetical protein